MLRALLFLAPLAAPAFASQAQALSCEEILALTQDLRGSDIAAKAQAAARVAQLRDPEALQRLVRPLYESIDLSLVVDGQKEMAEALRLLGPKGAAHPALRTAERDERYRQFLKLAEAIQPLKKFFLEEVEPGVVQKGNAYDSALWRAALKEFQEARADYYRRVGEIGSAKADRAIDLHKDLEILWREWAAYYGSPASLEAELVELRAHLFVVTSFFAESGIPAVEELLRQFDSYCKSTEEMLRTGLGFYSQFSKLESSLKATNPSVLRLAALSLERHLLILQTAFSQMKRNFPRNQQAVADKFLNLLMAFVPEDQRYDVRQAISSRFERLKAHEYAHYRTAIERAVRSGNADEIVRVVGGGLVSLRELRAENGKTLWELAPDDKTRELLNEIAHSQRGSEPRS